MTKLTIEKIVDDCCIDSYFVPFGFNKKALQHSIQTYAAQQNAELAAENERLKNEIDCPYCTENEQLKAENERLKQQLSSIVDICKPHKRMGAGGCDAMSEGRRQAKSELAKEVLAVSQPPKENN